MNNVTKSSPKEDYGRPLTHKETMGIVGFIAFIGLIVTIIIAYLYIK